jgi:Zn-dependent protease with chaperone function
MKKLNPFAFPPETNARFALLVFGAVIVVTSLFLVVWGKLILNPLSSSGFSIDSNFIKSQDVNAIVLYLCGAPFVIIFSLGGLLGTAYWSYRRHPARIIQQRKLQSLDPGRDKKLMEAVQELAHHAQIPMPEIHLGPYDAQDGQAFGFRSRILLRLGKRLKVMRLNADYLPSFQAIILHELAHIKNEDIQRTYFAEAIWKSLLYFASLLVLIFSTITILTYLNPKIISEQSILSPIFGLLFVAIPFAILLIIELGLIIGVVHFIRRGTLRIREMYADWRAAQWGALDGLIQVLSSAVNEKKNFWKRLLSAHPSSEDRVKALRDPNHLFKLTFDIPLLNGFLLGFAFSGMGSLFGLLSTFIVSPLDNALLSIFGLLSISIICIVVLFTLLWMLSSTVGLQIQREAVADQDKNIGGLLPYLRLFLFALLLHLGFEASVYLMPYENIQVDPLSKGIYAFLVFPFWILGISTMTWLWMSAIRFFARRWLGSHSGAKPPSAKISTITILGMLSLPALYVPFTMTRGWPAVGPGSLLTAFFVLILVGILFIAFCFAAWMMVAVFVPAPKCQKCGVTQAFRQTVRHVCRQCGAELAEWLYVQS